MLEKAQWPTCGLNLASTIITVLENVTSDFLAGEEQLLTPVDAHLTSLSVVVGWHHYNH